MSSSTVLDVAKAIIGDRKIPIKITGIRPGEKLHEIMISIEEAPVLRRAAATTGRSARCCRSCTRSTPRRQPETDDRVQLGRPRRSISTGTRKLLQRHHMLLEQTQKSEGVELFEVGRRSSLTNSRSMSVEPARRSNLGNPAVRRLKVLAFVGTRPELIKLSRVMAELDRHTDFVLVHSGQNYDYELNEVFFKDLGIRRPDVFLEAVGPTAAETIGLVIAKADKVLQEQQPDAVLIYGDTNTGLAVISAKRRKIPIFHMEAGNRCFDSACRKRSIARSSITSATSTCR